MKKQFALVGCLVCLSGCMTFTETEITKALPNDIAQRNNYVPTAEWKYELGELAGSILIERKTQVDGKLFYLGERIIKNQTEPEVKAISDGQLIRMYIDNSADAKLKIIGLGGVDLDVKKKMEFTYTDSSRAFIKQSDWDKSALTVEANKPLKNNEKAKYFIQGVLLSLLQRQEYSYAGSKTNATVNGSGMQVDSSIYSSSGVLTKDYAIHLTLRDLSDFKTDNKKIYSEESEVKGIWIQGQLTRE